LQKKEISKILNTKNKVISKRNYKKRKFKLKLNYLIPFGISAFIILCILIFVLIFIKINLNNYNNLEKQIQILKKSNLLQVEIRDFISNNIKMLKNSKMTDERKIQFLGLIFSKSLEYRDKFYLKPDFTLYHIKQESNFDEEALGKVGEKGLYQFHPLKVKEACRLYKLTEDQFTKSLEFQTDYYFYLMTTYLEFYKGDMDKALLCYNCGESIIEAFNNNIEYLKKVVYLDNNRKIYSDIIINNYKESIK